MHELAIVESIVAAVEDATRPRRVARVRLEIGALSGVLPEALAFCFELCARETPLDGAWLQIDEIPGRARCRACGTELALECLFDLCRCGSRDLEVEAGQELRIAEVEVQ